MSARNLERRPRLRRRARRTYTSDAIVACHGIITTRGAESAVPGVDNLAVGPDIQANNNPRLPGYDSVPMLDSVHKNIPDGTVSSPGSRMGLGMDLKF